MTPAVRDLILKGGPTLDLNMLSGVLDPRITFARASSGTYFDATGMLQIASANEPRFSYDPSTFAPRGLLVEEQRVNSILRSAEFDNASWTKGTSTVAANTIAAPDGTQVADTIESSQDVGVNQGVSGITSGLTYCLSIFVKAGTSTLFRLRNPNGPGWHIDVNLSTGAITSTSGALVVSGSTPISNGWHRVWFAHVADVDGITFNPRPREAGRTTYHLWGAQVEAGAFPTSYIPTTSAAATRAMDQASMLTGDWFSPIAGTLAYDYDAPSNIGVLGGLSDLTFNNTIYPSLSGAVSARAGGVGATFSTATPVTGGTLNKLAVSFGSTSVLGSTNGSAVGVGVPGSSPYSWTARLSIGCSPWNLDGAFGGHVRRVRYWPRALAEAQLQAITQ